MSSKNNFNLNILVPCKLCEKNSKYQVLAYFKGYLLCLELWHFEFFLCDSFNLEKVRGIYFAIGSYQKKFSEFNFAFMN